MANVPHEKSTESEERHQLLRELIVGASLEVLDRHGLGLRPDAVTYSKVFAHLADGYGVHIGRGSVHGRIWESQEDYRLEVLASAARYTADDRSRAMREVAVATLPALDQCPGRSRTLAFCRISSGALLDSTLKSDSFRRFQAIKAVARSADPDVDGAGETASASAFLQSIVRENDGRSPAERIAGLGCMFDALGLRPRTALGLDRDQSIDLFMTMVRILATGAHLDHSAGYTAMSSPVETSLPAEDESPWTYFAIGFLAFMDFLFEPDPDAVVDDIVTVTGREAVTEPASSPDGDGHPSLSSLIGTRPRRSRDELRRLVVAAGVELLLRDGVGLQAESITYARVFDHIKRTRGISLHRSTVHPHIWTGQDRFRNDVLAEAARFDTCESLSTMRQAMAAQTVTRNPDSSVNVRQLILDNSLAMMTAQMRVAATSASFRRWQLIKASTLSPVACDRFDDIRQVIRVHYAEMIDAVADVHRSVLPLVNLGVNPELATTDDHAYHLLAVISAAVTTGADYDIAAGSRLVEGTVRLPRADGSGASDDWPIPAIATLAVLDLLFVPRAGDENGVV